MTREWVAVTVAGKVVVTRCESRAEAIAQVLKEMETGDRIESLHRL